MDVRPLLRILAVVALAIAAVLGMRTHRRWPSHRVSGIVASILAVIAIAGFILLALDLLEPRAPVPGSLSLIYVRDDSDGETVEAASGATGAVRWRYMPSSGLLGPAQAPTLDNGVLYLGIGDTIRAMRASDGKQLWVAPVEGRADQEMPEVDHGVVYATAAGGIFAIRAIDGGQLWRRSWTATNISSAHVANGVVYVALSSVGNANNPQQATIFALHASDGAIIRKYNVLDQVLDTLTVADGVIYLRGLQSGLVALDTAEGRLLWQRRDLGVGPPPVVANGVVYISALLINSSPDAAVLALDARDGSERWRTPLDYASQYVTVVGQTLYVGGHGAYALGTSDGRVLWHYGSGAQFYQPVVADGVVFLGSSDFPNSFSFHPFGIGSHNFLNALDARTGKLYWRSSGTVEGSPVLLS